MHWATRHNLGLHDEPEAVSRKIGRSLSAMNTRAIEPTTGSSSSRYYFMVWLALGAAGIFYVTIASLAPEALRAADSTGGVAEINEQVTSLNTSVTKMAGRVGAVEDNQRRLNTQLVAAQTDVTNLQVKVADI